MATDPRALSSDIINMVLNGEIDDHLVTLREAISRRESLVSRRAAVTMTRGTKFLIKNVSPKYLNGVLVEFIEYTSGVAPVRCKFIYGAGRYREGQTINLRESHIGAVSL